MIRYLVIFIVMTTIFGLLPGLNYISTAIEIMLLTVSYTLVLLGFGNVQGRGVLPLFNKYTDGFLIAFVLLWAVLASIHGAIGFGNLFVLLRYIVLAYLVAKFLRATDIKWISYSIFIFGITQIVIGTFQLIGIMPWVLTDVPIQKDGLYGVFKDNISYAALLLVSMIVYIEIINNALTAKTIGITILFLCFIFLSGSRAFFLLGMLYFLLSVLKIRSKLLLISGGGIVVLLLLVSNLNYGESNKNFLFFLSDKYLIMAMHQRLGLLVELLPQYIASPDIFFGLGSDRDFAVSQIVGKYSFHFISPDHLTFIIEDVYWLTMLIYYGLIGTSFFLFYLGGIYYESRKINDSAEDKAGAVKVFHWLFVFALALGMTGQIFEVKTFSLFFWIFVGTLAIVRRELRERPANQ